MIYILLFSNNDLRLLLKNILLNLMVVVVIFVNEETVRG